MKKINGIVLTALLLIAASGYAKENIGTGQSPQRQANLPATAAGCKPSTDKINLDLNNVRCPILMNGDMWWDAVNNISRYEVPKGSGKTSLFAGAIWIGGKDQAGNLKVAAQTYRQSGSDFWPGPLNVASATIDPDECLNYDRHWKVNKADVQKFHDWITGKLIDPTYQVPPEIKTWPGNGDVSGRNEAPLLAPFFDVNNDGIYDYNGGDYPYFDLSTSTNTSNCYIDGSKLYGDQTIWWVFNDEGNIHTETGGAPFGLEIRAQAFEFQTNDEINNMTFYNYQIINRSSSQVNDTWFGAWVDPDLGFANDDYIGCDVTRGLGYVYNGEAFDPGTYGYGLNPPACGLDFFQGPLADDTDHIDNNRNGTIDEPGEQIIMSQFVYYNNDFSVIGNPLKAADYYHYMQGIWLDGTPITFGGNGHGGNVPTSFMFPGNTDPTNWGTGLGKNNGPPPPTSNWTESTAGDQPGDRRFLQSAGKFTLKPGAFNDIVTGAVWARTTSGGPLVSVKLMQFADDKAQDLFNACFSITNGPDAPDVTIRELDKELIIAIAPDKFSNDSMETNYVERDPKDPSTSYHFQGYQVYQLKDNSVSVTDLNDPDKARIVAQCDIQDGVGIIVNQITTLLGDTTVYNPVDEVDGADKGLQHAFDIKTDAFASGISSSLINHTTYFYTVIAYGYNPAELINPYTAQRPALPYLGGRRNVFTYTAIPHIPDPQEGGLILNSHYGSGPQIQRMQGTGNGGIVLEMTQESVNQALLNTSGAATAYRVNNPIYQSGHGPIDVEVYDPVKVGSDQFEVYLRDTTANVPSVAPIQLTNIGGDTTIDNVIAVNVSGSGNISSSYSCDTLSGPYTLDSINGSFTFTFNPPVAGVQIAAVFRAEGIPGQIHFERNGSAYPLSLSNLIGPVSLCADNFSGVISGGDLTNNTHASASPNNRVVINGSCEDPISTVTVSSLAMDSVNFGVVVTPCGNSKWYIKDLTSGEIDSSDMTIRGSNEKIFPQWGIKVNIQQVRQPMDQGSVNGGILESSIEFSDNNKQWLTGVSDEDGATPLNWIRSGTDTFPKPNGDWSMNVGGVGAGTPEDPSQFFEKIINGTWAPFRLVSYDNDGPVYSTFPHGVATKLSDLASVDIVITGDKTKWSRSVVIEEQASPSLSEGNAIKGEPRAHLSVDKNGKTVNNGGFSNPNDPNAADYVNATGMGWFPGYAINLETGERLNIMFGEDSYLQADNGRDMLFNPSPNELSPLGDGLLGGKHYVYIMNKGSGNASGTITVNYDDCKLLRSTLQAPSLIKKFNAWKDCMWVGLPLLATGHSLFETDVKVRIRMTKSYRYYDVGGIYSDKDPALKGIPYYRFGTSDLAAVSNSTPVAKTALDLINIVPNPYYAHSDYERNQLDNRVKIVNLPNTCTVSIYTSTGTLVRQFKRAIPSTTDLSAGVVAQSINNSSVISENAIDWDLKNSFQVPIAGGVYIIHIDAPGIGEKIIKWFGVIRPIDLDTF